MKTLYIKPAIDVVEIQAEQMMALSLQSGTADPDGEVFGKENAGDWNIWEK